MGKYRLCLDLYCDLYFVVASYIAYLVDSSHGGNLASIALGMANDETHEL